MITADVNVRLHHCSKGRGQEDFNRLVTENQVGRPRHVIIEYFVTGLLRPWMIEFAEYTGHCVSTCLIEGHLPQLQ